ncbi:hypothetical protein AB0J38_21640 [Streptomyces sp. NPDC050095]|uniref:hypothetical protein n=1 Tax=unclassified Streptomyces TaxID=2593676 RepID=UPI00343B5AEC
MFLAQPWAMTVWLRMWWWGLALLGAGAAVGLLVWVTAAHPDGSGQTWGVAGSVAGVAALGVSLWQLRTPAPGPAPSPVVPPVPPEPPAPVIADGCAIAARGNVTNSSTRYTGPVPSEPAEPPHSGESGVVSRDGSIAAGGDVHDSHTERLP